MVTRTGIEGGPVYAIGAAIRDALETDGRCVLEVDLRPSLSHEQVAERLQRRRPKDSGSNWLRRTLALDPVAIGLLREAGALPSDASAMASLVKAVPVVVTATMPIERAISTAGGIAWSEVDESLMLRRLPGHVRRGRDARLGGAHGRLPAAGLVQHRRGRGAGRAGLARA